MPSTSLQDHAFAEQEQIPPDRAALQNGNAIAGQLAAVVAALERITQALGPAAEGPRSAFSVSDLNMSKLHAHLSVHLTCAAQTAVVFFEFAFACSLLQASVLVQHSDLSLIAARQIAVFAGSAIAHAVNEAAVRISVVG